MKWPKLCIFGYISYISIELVVFVINTVFNNKKVSDFIEFLWIPNLILFGIIIFIGTSMFFLKKISNYNKILVIIFSLLITVIQMICLWMIAFACAMFIVAPILAHFGFHVTML